MSSIKDKITDDFRAFVKANTGNDTAALRLKFGATRHDEITQIECHRRFGRKLADTLSRFPDFYFPSTLSGEQSTSDPLAAIHAEWVSPDDAVVDLTSGLGIDAMHLASKCRSVTAVERNEELCEALRYNAAGLGLNNIEVLCGDCRELLPQLSGTVAFIDPARRATDGSRVFGLGDCEPDAVGMLPVLKENFDRLIVKASPMLDVARTITDLPGTQRIVALGTTTECKELDAIVDLHAGDNRDTRIEAITVLPDGTSVRFTFSRQEEANAPTAPIAPTPKAGQYLFEPYPATMKAAPFRLLAERFDLTTFHANTHLYLGSDVKDGFPGEAYRIVEVVPWASGNIKRLHKRYPRLSVTARNFGMTAQALAKKLGVKEGGDHRLFAIGLEGDRRLMLVTDKRPC